MTHHSVVSISGSAITKSTSESPSRRHLQRSLQQRPNHRRKWDKGWLLIYYGVLYISNVFMIQLQVHIRILESTQENISALLLGLEYLIKISYVDDTAVFKKSLPPSVLKIEACNGGKQMIE